MKKMRWDHFVSEFVKDSGRIFPRSENKGVRAPPLFCQGFASPDFLSCYWKMEKILINDSLDQFCAEAPDAMPPDCQFSFIVC